jgi:acetylornithine deacetylase/succinyl-diaminopimelate desuccinylase-like protein
MRIFACIAAQNAVRTRLKDRGQVRFESCASDVFDIDLSPDDRNYRVSGYATVLSTNVRPGTCGFSVRLRHYPGAYGDWGFEVIAVEIDTQSGAHCVF